jgi:hypothetical protein
VDTRSMVAVRRGSCWGHLAFTALFLVSVVVQFLLAGFATFGAMSFEAHKTMGFAAVHSLSILVLLAALVAWLPRLDIGLSFLVAALTTVQVALPTAGNDWIAGLHPVNALVLAVLAHVLLKRSRARLLDRR